jgi:hypothetical protein
MSAVLPNPTPHTTGARDSVLSIPIFRKLWRAMAFILCISVIVGIISAILSR